MIGIRFSQQDTPLYRGVNRAQKIGIRLGGSPDLLQPFDSVSL